MSAGTETRGEQHENLLHKTLLEGLKTNQELTGNLCLVCFGSQSFSKCSYQQLRNGEGERILVVGAQGWWLGRAGLVSHPCHGVTAGKKRDFIPLHCTNWDEAALQQQLLALG